MPLIERRLHKNTLKQVTDADDLSTPDEVIASWNDSLVLKTEDVENDIKGLRNPQLGGIYAALTHWTYSESIATIVMPTGTGKTETMLSLLVHSKCSSLLVIVPTDPLREQISNKFLELGLLKKPLKILNENALHPIVGILKKRFSNAAEALEFMDKCNVVVATASILSKLSEDVLEVFIQQCTHVFIDEAHHAEARTWFEIRNKFKEKRILQFTATPYRNDGKRAGAEIIYSYPLKRAQQEGYFKKIDFIPLYEYEPKKADKAIADKAVEVLRADRENFPHILLARVETKKRADEVYEIYASHTDLKVAKIYSGIPDKENIKRAISNKEFQVVVCVDMLGEGFDLPELKIAAFHDVKKSLPTTIQFVGRFTRTKYDEKLGSAKIIVNIGGLKINDSELDEFYAQDSDWDELLPRVSELKTQKEIDFHETISGFKNVEDFVVSLRSLKPAMSTVIFKGNSGAWEPKRFEEAVKTKRSELVKSIINNEKNILAGIKAEKLPQKWTDNADVFDLNWTLYVIHWNEEQDLLFIHSSDNESLHESLAKSIIGDEAEIIDGKNKGQIFRSLDGVKRFKLQNVGLIQLLGKLIRFQMSVGTDIEPALSKAEVNRAKKSHVFGVGYENGASTTIGCSYKGRVWANIRDDIDVFIKWCENVGRKVLDENIDPEQVLRGAIIPTSVSEPPSVFPVCIDWCSDMYHATEDRYEFRIGDNRYYFYNSELVLMDSSADGKPIKFGLESDNETVAQFELQIFPVSEDYNDFKIVKTYPSEPVTVIYGRQEIAIEDFFYKSTPEIWFADGSVLEGSSLSRLKEDIEPYPSGKILTWDWTDVDLSKESQKVDPKVTNSIQYRSIEILKDAATGYDIIYDDDYSGEIADIITIKRTDRKMFVELYHLKFAKGGRVSREIENLYEVCGQAQKSIHWTFKQGKELFEHLLRRKTKCRKGKECPRLERGTEEQLKDLMNLAKYKIPLEFKIFIVQPSIPKSRATQEQLTLLGVTENYLREKAQIELVVIGSD